eukprot:TRINITY_DN1989_c2_g2_i2.p1 TRINITY_DN1989_c2_g2~~TRINITY_DN1989_c2_g2_i2.p1  ORF type:complete len:354 (+),score=125.10 TRINITY_DN1989_c2_g2_i2:91-1152(+)
MPVTAATAVQCCPPGLKALNPYLTRARDFAERNPTLSYYCLKYAIEQGMTTMQGLPPDQKGAAGIFLGDLMTFLEADKATSAAETDEEAIDWIKQTALLLFKRADDWEKSGRADKSVVTTFYSASVLMEVLKQFGPLEPRIADMWKYARYTSSQIKKALDSGVPYVSPNAGEDQQPAAAAAPATPDPYAAQPPPPSHPPPQRVQQQPVTIPLHPIAPAQAPASSDQQLEDLLKGIATRPASPPAVAAPQPPMPEVQAHRDVMAAAAREQELQRKVVELTRQRDQLLQQLQSGGGGSSAAGVCAQRPGFDPTLDHTMEAQRLAKFAVSALQFKDVTTARTNLTQALNVINTGKP